VENTSIGIHDVFMSQPAITELDVAAGDSIFDLETILNETIGQSVKSVAMNGSQLLVLETQNGVNNECFITKARDGILSGCAFAFTAPLAFTIAAGNWQANGVTESLGVSTPLSFGARHATLPRIDMVYATVINPPSIAVIAGTASANPQPPTRTSAQAPLYLVWIDPTIVTTPQDFVIGSFRVDAPFPTDSAFGITNGAFTAKLPIRRKSIDFDPAQPLFDADIIRIFTTGTGGFTVDLPDPANYEGQTWRFIDVDGDLAGNNVLFDATASGAFTINGAANTTISTDFQQYCITVTGGAFYGW
jgi:hypothetical protein